MQQERASVAGASRGDGSVSAASSQALTTCFGYVIRSALPFDFLRKGDSNGTALQVIQADDELPEPPEEPLMLWTDESGRPFGRLHHTGAEYLVWMDNVGSFRVDPGAPAITVPRSSTGPRREVRLWGIPTALCLMARGDLLLHAAAVEVDGTALILAAPGRYGKTTLGSAFLQAGHRLLSEDTTCFRLSPVPSVLPGPAALRVRPDVYERLEFPRTRIVARDPERVYLALDDAIRGNGSPVPIGGVVFLRRSDDTISMERVPAHRALPDLWTLGFKFPNDADRTRCFRGIAELAAQVPVWNLYRRLSFEELPAVVDRIASTCLVR
jgi:hypothetical protein